MAKDDQHQDEEPKSKPGPEEERLNIDLDWEEAAKQITKTKRPKEGWPDTSDGP